MFSKIFSPFFYKIFGLFFTRLSPGNTLIHDHVVINYHEIMVKFLPSGNYVDVHGKSRKRFIESHEGIDSIFPVDDKIKASIECR